jgi:hypothetical protein
MTKLTATILGLLVFGCGDDGASNGAASAADVYGHFDEETAVVETGLTAHQEGIDGAASLVEVTGLERDYRDRMRAHLGTLGSICEMMGACMRRAGMDGMGDHTDALVDGVESARGELERHVGAMGGVGDLDAARAEEARHGSAMDALFGQMRAHRGELQQGAGSAWSCDDWEDDRATSRMGGGCPHCW